MTKHVIWQLVIGLLLVVVLYLVYAFLSSNDILSLLDQREALLSWVRDLGVAGPLAIIGLLAVAIVISPLPSAPIALVAGAVYGHVWGTLYTLIGAEVGALIAFTLARLLGYSVLRHWFGIQLERGWIGSQNTIMLIVFASRLMPFLSFDLISYAAGLTILKPWRFFIATLFGILPASFILAHFGSALGTGNSDRILLTISLLGLLAILPLVFHKLWKVSVLKGNNKPD